MAQRYTRLSSPPTQDPYLMRVWRAITELQAAAETSLQETAVIETDIDALETAVDALDVSAMGAWAVITASGDQAGIDESTPDLVTAFDTVYDGSASHGVTVSAGVISLPANTPGYQWQVEAHMVLVGSAASEVWMQFYEAPAGANTAAGLTGFYVTASDLGHAAGSTTPIAWVTGATTVGVRCTATTAATTVTLDGSLSRIVCREVRA